jgi:cysteine desulfurase
VTVLNGPDGDPVYLDHNATTPVDPRVVEACLPYLTTHFGNPSSSHAYGQHARAAVDAARTAVAGLLSCAPGEIVFTGGGCDGDTLAIRGAALAHRDRGTHLITQATEHPAVLATVDALRRLHGFRVTVLPVDQHGLVHPGDLEAALTDDTVLVSIMHANGETGTIQPIRELADLAHARGALFHTDAAQTAGKIPVSVRELGADLLTVAGHKMYAPKGIGALYVHTGLELEPTTYGGGQEAGRRSGTENVALIVALGQAARLTDQALQETPALQGLRDLLQHRLTELLPGRTQLNGHPTRRLPNTLNVSISGTTGRDLLAATPEIAGSTGSACHEGTDHPSPVLSAMGLPPERAYSAVRLTLGRWSTESDVDRTVAALTAAASQVGPAAIAAQG